MIAPWGCGSPQWHGWTYDLVHSSARRENKLTFVYLRSWTLVECTNFEQNVLKAEPVRDLLVDVKSVMLETGTVKVLTVGRGLDPPSVRQTHFAFHFSQYHPDQGRS